MSLVHSCSLNPTLHLDGMRSWTVHPTHLGKFIVNTRHNYFSPVCTCLIFLFCNFWAVSFCDFSSTGFALKITHICGFSSWLLCAPSVYIPVPYHKSSSSGFIVLHNLCLEVFENSRRNIMNSIENTKNYKLKNYLSQIVIWVSKAPNADNVNPV